MMAPHRVGQIAGDILGQPEHLAHFADGAAGAIADHGGGQGGAATAITAIDILDDLLAPLMLEIHVNVGRLAPLGIQEALEQHIENRWDRWK